jgi:hypothetical protein
MGRTAEAKAAKAHIASAIPTAAGHSTADMAPADVSTEQMSAIADALDQRTGSSQMPGGSARAN